MRLNRRDHAGHRVCTLKQPPVAISGLIPLVEDLPEGINLLIEQSPQVGAQRIAWAVEHPGFDTSGDHGRKREAYRCARIPCGNTCTTVVEGFNNKLKSDHCKARATAHFEEPMP